MQPDRKRLTGASSHVLSAVTQPEYPGVYLWVDDTGAQFLVNLGSIEGREFYGTFYYLGRLASDFVVTEPAAYLWGPQKPTARLELA